MYDKAKCKAVGVALVTLVDAVTTDGAGLEDLDEFLALVTSLNAAKEEITTDRDAALLHILGGAAENFGDRRMNPPA